MKNIQITLFWKAQILLRMLLEQKIQQFIELTEKAGEDFSGDDDKGWDGNDIAILRMILDDLTVAQESSND